MNQVKKYCNYIGIVGCLLLLIGNFFTFVTVKASVLGISQSEAVKFVDGDGIIVIIAAIVAAVFIYLKKGRWNYAPALISAAVAIYDVMDAKDAATSVGSLAKVSIHYGIGFFMIMLGAITLAIYAFLYKANDKDILPLTKEALTKKK